MRRIVRLSLVASVLAMLLMTLRPAGASAHPMGNFSINQYSALTIGSDKVEVRYIVDMAEIPTFQELSKIRPDHSTDLTPVQHDAFVAAKSADLMKGLSLTRNGQAVPLVALGTELSFPVGSGGLPTLRFEMELSAETKGLSSGDIEYRDTNFADRVGWKEVIAVPAEGIIFQQSDVPQQDVTNGLTQYSPTATTRPLNRTGATVKFTPGVAVAMGGQAATEAENAPQGAVDWAKQRIEDVASLIAQDNLPLGAMLLGLVIAFFWGAGHALSPGHGKTVLAAYLVGTRGTPVHAALLGLTVTVSHTVGVFALGLVVLFAANFIVPDQLYPVIGCISGGSIVLLGLVMFWQRFRSARDEGGRTHDVREHEVYEHDRHPHNNDHHDHGHDHHDHGDHSHTHDHDHTHEQSETMHRHGPFGRPHTHVPGEGHKVSMKGLLALGITGGIIPCPTALVVLLAAIAYHRVALGLAWILSFSLGLAAVLTALGLLIVYGRGLLGKRNLLGRAKITKVVMGRLPMASALVVAVLGFLIALQSLQR